MANVCSSTSSITTTPVHKITIVGRGRAGGYTRVLPAEDRHYQTRSQFAASIASALGGHAAETASSGK